MGELAYPIKIRGHHLLCLLGFRGLGYSPEFVATMGRVLERFRSDATLPIILVTECDIICDSCPHKKGGKCQKKGRGLFRFFRAGKSKDARVLKKLGMPAGIQTTSGEAWRMVKERVSPEDLTKMCRKCEWVGLGYCHEGLIKLAKG